MPQWTLDTIANRFTSKFVHSAHAVIAYNRRIEPELVGFDEHFAPTCVREHSYRYDSYDLKYETLKDVRLKECVRTFIGTGFAMPEGIQDENDDRSSQIHCPCTRNNVMERNSLRRDPQSNE